MSDNPSLTPIQGGNKKYKFIVGTTGGYDYLVVAKKGNYVLGVKPLLIPTPPVEGTGQKMIIGARIRVALDTTNAPDSVVEIDSSVVQFSKNITLENVFDNIDWKKKSEKRKSTEIGLALPFTPWVHGTTEQNIEKVRYHWKVYNWLVDNVGQENITMDQEDIIQFLKDKYKHEITEAEKYFSATKVDVDITQELQPIESVFQKMINPDNVKKEQIAHKGFKVVDNDKED